MGAGSTARIFICCSAQKGRFLLLYTTETIYVSLQNCCWCCSLRVLGHQQRSLHLGEAKLYVWMHAQLRERNYSPRQACVCLSWPLCCVQKQKSFHSVVTTWVRPLELKHHFTAKHWHFSAQELQKSSFWMKNWRNVINFTWLPTNSESGSDCTAGERLSVLRQYTAGLIDGFTLLGSLL